MSIQTLQNSNLFEIRKSKIIDILEAPEYTDLSPKGSVDERMKPIMKTLNNHIDYVTTSSCSGRVSAYCMPEVNPNEEVENDQGEAEAESERTIMKGGGHWFYVTHDPIDSDLLSKESFDPLTFLFGDLKVKLNEESKTKQPFGSSRLIWLNFEPMILHTQCRTIDRCRQLVAIASQLGYRDSGMVIGNKFRYMAEIRSSIKLDVPIGIYHEEAEIPYVQLLVDIDYLIQLLKFANSKFDDNFSKMERFRQKLIHIFKEEEEAEDNPVESKEDRRIRKRMEGLKLQQLKQAEKEKKLLDTLTAIEDSIEDKEVSVEK